MILFRAVLIALFLILGIYTVVVGETHGWDLLPVFFGDIARMNWPGQFNLDFTFMLVLSALWTAWRNRFSVAGLALGLLALTGGSLFLTLYLLVLTLKHQGDMKKVLLGER